jgi:hypothetical protein
MGVRKLSEMSTLTVTVVSRAYIITGLHADTLHHSVFVIYNFQAQNNSVLPLLHRIISNMF